MTLYTYLFSETWNKFIFSYKVISQISFYMYIYSFGFEFCSPENWAISSKMPLVFVWIYRGKAFVWTECDLKSCHLYCHCLMLCSLRNVKYQLVVGRECFCSGLCLPVGASLAGECRKPLRRRTDHTEE